MKYLIPFILSLCESYYVLEVLSKVHIDYDSYIFFLSSEYFIGSMFFSGLTSYSFAVFIIIFSINVIYRKYLVIIFSIIFINSFIISVGYIRSTFLSMIMLLLFLYGNKNLSLFLSLLHPVSFINILVLYLFNNKRIISKILLFIIFIICFNIQSFILQVLELINNESIIDDYIFLFSSDFFVGKPSFSIIFFMLISFPLVFSYKLKKINIISQIELNIIKTYLFFSIIDIYYGGAFFERLVAFPLLISIPAVIIVYIRLLKIILPKTKKRVQE